jgi:serine protease Do
VNLNGEVVGINTWIASQTGGSIGLGFAIPVNNARRAITDFIQDGAIAYSWLGVQATTLSDEFATELGLADNEGAFVSGVYEGSPAADSGLRPGDVITAIAGQEISTSNDLVRTVANLEPGAQVSFEIIRGGNEMTMTVRTGRRTAESGTSADVWPGIAVGALTDDIREELDLRRNTDGVVVGGVAENSSAAASGLRPGDTIIGVNDQKVDSVAGFYQAINGLDDDEIQFRVIRGGREIMLGFVREAA